MSKQNARIFALAVSGLLVACSLVLGVLGKAYLTFGPIRLTFENLPVLLGGFFFGPLIGGVIGVCSDLLSCLVAANPINPIITLGAFAVGLTAGLLKKKVFRSSALLSFLASSLFAHIVGSMIIKSAGLRIYYLYPYSLILLRIPLYLVISTLEGYFIYVFSKIKAIQKIAERM